MNFLTDKYQIGTVQPGMAGAGTTNTAHLAIKLDNLVRDGDDIFDYCQPDGGDIRVTDGTGTVQYPVEVVDINTTAKTGTIWIAALNGIASGGTVRVYVNGTDTMPSPTSTYGSQAVWYGWQSFHLNGSAANSANVSGAADGVETDITYSTDSLTTGSAVFNGSTSKIGVPFFPPNAKLYYAANFKLTAYPPAGQRAVLAGQTEYYWHFGDGANRGRLLYATFIDDAGKLWTWWNQNSSWNPLTMVDTGITIDLNRWYRFQSEFRWYDTSDFWLDGVLIGTYNTNFNMSFLGYYPQNFTMGKATTEFSPNINKSAFTGLMSEVNWSKDELSNIDFSETALVEANNQLYLDTFWSWSPMINTPAVLDDSNIFYWQNF